MNILGMRYVWLMVMNRLHLLVLLLFYRVRRYLGRRRRERGGEAADAAADASADDEVELSDGPPSPTQQPQPPDGGGNTRMAAARWPPSELSKLPPSLRPVDGEETLDLILRTRVLLLQARRGYRANADSMLLPFYAARRVATAMNAAEGGDDDAAPLPSPPKHLADVGCGNGLVGILAALHWQGAKVHLFERQPSLARLAERNLRLNGIVLAGDDAVGISRGLTRVCDCMRSWRYSLLLPS